MFHHLYFEWFDFISSKSFQSHFVNGKFLMRMRINSTKSMEKSSVHFAEILYHLSIHHINRCHPLSMLKHSSPHLISLDSQYIRYALTPYTLTAICLLFVLIPRPSFFILALFFFFFFWLFLSLPLSPFSFRSFFLHCKYFDV